MSTSLTYRYVLVTPARNEEAFIGSTIRSVLAQTYLPKQWIIVSDGSTDETDRIVTEASKQHSWIKLIRVKCRNRASFVSVVHNTTLGIDSVTADDYLFLGLLDADIKFQSNYFERLIEEFHKDHNLGLAGGVAIDIGHSKLNLPKNRLDIPGALQFFRRECFESLGGLIPIPEGGWDILTCVMARMNGYKTRLVTDLIVDHLKPRNVSQGGRLKRKWQLGVRDCAIGYHPIFEFVKCIGRFKEQPFILTSVIWWLGYISEAIKRKNRIVPQAVIDHLRNEQMQRLKTTLKLLSQ